MLNVLIGVQFLVPLKKPIARHAIIIPLKLGLQFLLFVRDLEGLMNCPGLGKSSPAERKEVLLSHNYVKLIIANSLQS